MKQAAWVLALVGMLACGPAREAVAPDAAGGGDDPWPLLSRGDLAGAEAIFSRWLDDAEQRPFALMGLLRIAVARGDAAAAERLLPQAMSPYPVLILAADAAMIDDAPSPVGREVMEHACPPPADMRDSLVARTICAHVAAFRGKQALSRCASGCDGSHRAPLTLLTHLPVVMLRVGDAAPAPFIVDTGAATTSVSHDFARAAGLAPIAQGEHVIGTPGGLVEAHMTVGDVSLGDLTIADVKIAVVDVTLAGAVGIVSPHDVFRALRFTLDLAGMQLEVAPSGGPAPSDHAFDFLFQARRPHILVSVEGRPAHPMLIDTGLPQSRISSALEALGDPIERGAALGGTTLGGQVIVAASRTPLSWSAGALRWQLPTTIGPVSGGQAARDLATFGMLGMDFALGRRISVDVPARRLYLGDGAAPGLPEVAQTLEITRPDREPLRVREQVVGREEGLAVIEVQAGAERFRVAVPDDHEERSRWLATRKVKKAWLPDGDGWVEAPASAGLQRYVALIHPFATQGTARIAVALHEGMPCTEIESAARLEGGGAARLTLRDCPAAGPWWKRSVRLADPEGATLWQLRQLSPE